jgi:hypothetical protein
VNVNRLVHETGEAGREFAAKVNRVLRFADAHGHAFQPGGVNVILVLLQLDQHIAAVDSAKVPQERQQHRPVAPTLRERHRLALGVQHRCIGRAVANSKNTFHRQLPFE